MIIDDLWDECFEQWQNNEDANNVSDLYEVFVKSFWRAYDAGYNEGVKINE